MLDQITPLIITYDEAANIRRTLEKLKWADRIVVVDSGSTDETLEILNSDSRIDVYTRVFLNFADQCNFGLTCIRTPWVLSLDADYVLTDHLIDELRDLTPGDEVAGYRAKFVYKIHGRRLRGSLYPPRTVLYLKEAGYYKNEGHGHRIKIMGEILELKGAIFHDDRKSLARWYAAQLRYAAEEREYIHKNTKISIADRTRRLGWPAPVLALIYTLFAKGCILDGWAGWHYALQRLIGESLVALEIADQKLREKE